MPFLASFLIVLGLLQLTAVYFKLRGASLTGPLAGPGILIGILIFTLGVWFAIDIPTGLLVVWALPALPLAALLLALAGILVNLGWNPAQHFLSAGAEGGWTAQDVHIPMRLAHIAQSAATAEGEMPATFMKPASWDAPGFVGGAAVLVVCGAGDCRMAFKWHLFGELLAQGLAVLTVDPPGHGDFLHVPMTVANARIAGKAALDWLCAQPGVARAGAIGISFGGNQVAALAARDERLKAVALISTPVRLDSLTRRTYAAEVAALFVWPRNLGLLREGSLLTLWREWRTLKGAWYGESLYDMIAQLDTPAAVRAIGARPTLFAHGTRDVAIPAHNAQSLYDAAAPERELMLMRQGTHISPVLFPAEMRRLARWFAQRLNYNLLDAQQVV